MVQNDAWDEEVVSQQLEMGAIRELMGQFPSLSEQAELADLLRDYTFPAPASKEIRTIATFYYAASNGGVERVLCHLLCLWERMGYRVVLLTDDRPETGEEEYPLPEGIHRYRLPDTFQLTDRTRWKRYQELQRILKEEQVDMLVHHAWLSRNMLWDLLAVKNLGIPFVQYVHGVFSCLISEGNPEDMDILRCLVRINALSDAVISLSQTSRRFWGLFQARSFLLCNPCDEPKTANIEKRPFHLVWVGRIAPEKRPLDAVKILHEVRRSYPEATLTMVGSAHPAYQGLQEELAALIHDLGEEEHVTLAGFHVDPSPFYQEATLLLMTSAYEGFSLTIAEAKTYGLPCVMYDLPYTYFAEENLGVIRVRQRKYREAARAVMDCFADPAKLRELSMEALRSSRHFSDEVLTEQWKTIFEGLKIPRPAREISQDALAWRTMLDHLQVGMRKWEKNAQNFQESMQAFEQQRQAWESERQQLLLEKQQWEQEREILIRRDQESFKLLRRIKRAIFR